jgi:ABC-type polysaccharide/polyol phosphate transport system ATPase subunit
MTAIRFDHVTKQFTLHRQRSRSFQELFLSALRFRRNHPKEQYLALHDISFDVQAGEMVGIIGPNGAGKSTILKLVSRIIEPTSGDIAINGRVGALLELGSGFHPDLTGRENIYLNGSIIGFTRKKMDQILENIIDFSEMSHFVDVPVKHYSSGMFMRLGFSIAIHVEPDILLVDEVLAVGDQSFQIRCLDKIHDMKRQGVAIVLVTHDLESVRRMCDRVIWLQRGQIEAEGPVEHVLEQYMDQVLDQDEQALLAPQPLGLRSTARPTGSRSVEPTGRRSTPIPKSQAGTESLGGADGCRAESADDSKPAVIDSSVNRWGSREAEIVGVQLLDDQGSERRAFKPGGTFIVRIHFCANTRIERPQFGLALFHPAGFHINGPNTVFSGLEIGAIEGEGHIDYVVESLPLLEGTYLVSVSLYDHAGSHAYDYHHQAYTFRVRPSKLVREKYGSILIPAQWRTGPTGFELGQEPPPQPTENG